MKKWLQLLALCFVVMIALATSVAAADIASGVSGGCDWVINASGILTVSPSDGGDGVLAEFGTDIPWKPYATKINKIYFQDGVVLPSYCYGLFKGCKNATTIDLSGIDTSQVTNMGGMFDECRMLERLDLSNFDTSNVTDMSNMFNYCWKLTTLDLSSFDTTNVKLMYNMFSYCSNLKTVDVSSFNTSNVEYMCHMFYECYSLEKIDLSSFDASNALRVDNMFKSCSKMTEVIFGNFNPVKAESISSMFYGCSLLKILDLSSFDTSSAINYYDMIYKCSKLEQIIVSETFTVPVAFPNSFRSSADNMVYGTIIPGVAAEYILVPNEPVIDGYTITQCPGRVEYHVRIVQDGNLNVSDFLETISYTGKLAVYEDPMNNGLVEKVSDDAIITNGMQIHFMDVKEYVQRIVYITVIGDLKGEGLPTATDRMLLSRYLARFKNVDLNWKQKLAADINGDGLQTALDRIILSRHLENWDGYADLSVFMQ